VRRISGDRGGRRATDPIADPAALAAHRHPHGIPVQVRVIQKFPGDFDLQSQEEWQRRIEQFPRINEFFRTNRNAPTSAASQSIFQN
jgi:hypothetical protein